VREMIIGLLVLAALLLAVDVLAWQGLRRALALKDASRARRVAAALFWGTAALVQPVLAFALLLARADNDATGWGIVSTVSVLYLPKVVLAAAVVADWTVAGLGRLAVRLAIADPARRAARSAGLAGIRALSLVGLGLAAATYAWFLIGATAGRNTLTVRRVDVPIAALPAALDGLVIAHVSDLHLSSLRDRPGLVRKLLEAIERASPDLIVCTGDLAPVSELDQGPEVLGRLESRLGTFAAPGNHDFGTQEMAPEQWESSAARDREVAALREEYARRGAHVLVNEAVAVDVGAARLTLIGTGVFDEHHGYRDSDLDLAAAGIDGDDVAILLTHNPEVWDLEVVGRRPIALTLAGHTHGGQIGVEAGPLRLSLASLSLRRWAGLYREGDQYLYVNRGVGLYGPPFRAGIPAELALIRLVRTKPPT